MITSRQNSKAKWVRALQGRARERRSENAFLAEGVRLVEEAVRSDWPLRFLIYSDRIGARGTELVDTARTRGVDVEHASEGLLRWLSDTETSQGLLAVVEQRALPLPEHPDFLLIPDQIRDPGNMGALLRSAEAAGVQGVLISPGSADAFSPKTVRAGMGAHFRLPIHTLTWDEIRSRVLGMQVFLAEMSGRSAWQSDLSRPLALVVGGEAQGASVDAQELATERLSVPMHSSTESLNAAVAGSVLMFEVARQRAALSQPRLGSA